MPSSTERIVALASAIAATAACGPRPSAPPSPIATSTSSVPPTPAASAVASAVQPTPAPKSGAIVERKSFGGTANVDADAIAIDARGHRIVVGSYQGSAVFGETKLASALRRGAFIVDLDAAWKPAWALAFGGEADDFVSDVVVDASGIYVGGAFESPTLTVGSTKLKSRGLHDIFLAKFDTSGAALWAKATGDAQEQMDVHLAAIPSGGVIATGWMNGVLDFGSGAIMSPRNKSFFAARIDADGRGRWGKTFGHRVDLAETAAAVGKGEQVFVSAASDPTFDVPPGGAPEGEFDVGPLYVVLDKDGKTSSLHRYGRGADNLTTAIAADSKGSVRFASASTGSTTFTGEERRPSRSGDGSLVLTSFDAAGAVVWSRELLSAPGVAVRKIVLDKDDAAIVVGRTTRQGPLGQRQDGFVIKVDAGGTVVWALDVNDGSRAEVSGVAIDPSGNIVAVGTVVGADGRSTENQLWLATIAP
jgi:hypothetical protein